MANLDASDRLSRIRCPSLIFVGDKDLNTPPYAASVLGRAGQGLRTELCDRVTTTVIKAAGHALFREQTDAVAEAIISYLFRNMPGRLGALLRPSAGRFDRTTRDGLDWRFVRFTVMTGNRPCQPLNTWICDGVF